MTRRTWLWIGIAVAPAVILALWPEPPPPAPPPPPAAHVDTALPTEEHADTALPREEDEPLNCDRWARRCADGGCSADDLPLMEEACLHWTRALRGAR